MRNKIQHMNLNAHYLKKNKIKKIEAGWQPQCRPNRTVQYLTQLTMIHLLLMAGSV
jgi:hypothetical protein